MGDGKQNPKSRDKAIRVYCLDCMAGQKLEVRTCPSGDCPLFPYRKTGVSAQKSHIGQKISGKNPAETKGTVAA